MRKNNEKIDNKFWGKNTQDFLVQVSRKAIENYNENSVLFFEVDYNKSKRNFYGEYETIEFINKKGIEVKGVINIKNEEVDERAKMINQNTSLEFSCYIDHLKDLGIKPELGNYFSYKNKFYYIYNKIALDANQNVIAGGNKPIWQRFDCYEEDGETLYGFNYIGLDDEGSQNEIY